MIPLDTPFVTTIQRSIDTEVQTTTTDTLRVSRVWIDFTAVLFSPASGLNVPGREER
jgi:hypothetical protein